MDITLKWSYLGNANNENLQFQQAPLSLNFASKLINPVTSFSLRYSNCGYWRNLQIELVVEYEVINFTLPCTSCLRSATHSCLDVSSGKPMAFSWTTVLPMDIKDACSRYNRVVGVWWGRGAMVGWKWSILQVAGSLFVLRVTRQCNNTLKSPCTQPQETDPESKPLHPVQSLWEEQRVNCHSKHTSLPLEAWGLELEVLLQVT